MMYNPSWGGIRPPRPPGPGALAPGGYFLCENLSSKNVFAGYLGWFNGNPTTLNPLSDREEARKIIEDGNKTLKLDIEKKKLKFNSEIEKENAGIGFTYDSAKNVFTPPQPYPSWTLEESTSEWKPPIAEPDPNPDADGRWLEWNEELYQSDNTKGWEYLELSE